MRTDIGKCIEVELAGTAYYNMIRSAVEVKSRETAGNIFGNVCGKTIRVINACPIQTAERKPSSVTYNDDLAIARLKALEHVIDSNGSRTRFIGGYHSHPVKGFVKKLTVEDRRFANGELEESLKAYWLEILLNIEGERYKDRTRISELVYQDAKALDTHFAYKPYRGYHLSIRAFLVDARGGTKQLKVTKRKK